MLALWPPQKSTPVHVPVPAHVIRPLWAFFFPKLLSSAHIDHFYKMLYWIKWIVLLSLEPLAGELEYASVEWSAAGAWVGRVSNV